MVVLSGIEERVESKGALASALSTAEEPLLVCAQSLRISWRENRQFVYLQLKSRLFHNS